MKNNIVADFTIFPIGKGVSLSAHVARIIKIVDSSGLDYKLHSMGTNIEGPWDKVFSVIKKCFDEMRRDSERISLSVRVDYKKGASGRLEGKVKSVEAKLRKKAYRCPSNRYILPG